MSTNLTFGEALIGLRYSEKLSRAGWNGPEQYIELQTPDENSKMTIPYLFIRTVQADLVPWFPSQTDLLANDWFTV